MWHRIAVTGGLTTHPTKIFDFGHLPLHRGGSRLALQLYDKLNFGCYSNKKLRVFKIILRNGGLTEQVCAAILSVLVDIVHLAQRYTKEVINVSNRLIF